MSSVENNEFDPAADAVQAPFRPAPTLRLIHSDTPVELSVEDLVAARFHADLDAESALLALGVLDHIAGQVPDQARGGRGINQVRADVLADLFLGLAENGQIDLRGLATGESETPSNLAGAFVPGAEDPEPTAATEPTTMSAADSVRAGACTDHPPVSPDRTGWCPPAPAG